MGHDRLDMLASDEVDELVVVDIHDLNNNVPVKVAVPQKAQHLPQSTVAASWCTTSS